MNETTLCTLYEIASRKPGWLTKIDAICCLTEQEINFLTWLDDQETQINKRLREMESQMRRDGFDETLIDCETDDERLAKLNKLVFTIEDAHEELKSMDKPYLERALYLLTERYAHWTKLRNKIRAKMIHVTTDHGVTDAEIETARNVPFDAFCDVIKKFTHCLWHEDSRPSMLVSNGFGWCFSCGTWCDPIKWWMKKNGRNFVETVKVLSKI